MHYLLVEAIADIFPLDTSLYLQIVLEQKRCCWLRKKELNRRLLQQNSEANASVIFKQSEMHSYTFNRRSRGDFLWNQI